MSSKPGTSMRAARLYGVRDLRVERLPRPDAAPGELLVEIEACGVCPTDVRKYLIGVGDGGYPLNPGHEWVGRVAAVGAEVDGWAVGDRVYGDTYAGYAEYATLPAGHGTWSHGPLRLDDALPLERAVFVEPLADCIHAVSHQARIGDRRPRSRRRRGADGPPARRRRAGRRRSSARRRPARAATPPRARFRGGGGGSRRRLGGRRPRVVGRRRGAAPSILALGRSETVAPGLRALAPGGRLVLFAGFGDRSLANVDLNVVHYRELAIVGSEWVGTPPNSRLECYREAHALLSSGRLRLERLVTRRCTLDTLVEAFADVQSLDALKIVLTP